MGKLKLKVPKAPRLDWKGKTLKLQRIVLAGAALVELDREALDMFELMRKGTRKLLEADARLPTEFSPTLKQLVWEPYSNERGKEELIGGWDLSATLYTADGKPWWLVRAVNKLDEPSKTSWDELGRVVDFLGAHLERDCIMREAFGGGYGCSMWWSWINQLPLLEMQFRKEPFAIRTVTEGSPLPPGYQRIERATGQLSR